MRRGKGGSSKYTRTSDKKLITIGEIIVIIVASVLIFRNNFDFNSCKRHVKELSASQSQSKSADNNEFTTVVGKHYDIGDTVYAENGIDLTVTSVKDNYDEYDEKYKSMSDNYKFIAVDISYHNRSAKNIQTKRVDCYCSGNGSCDKTYENAYKPLELDAGETFEELAVFAIPKGAEDIELQFMQSSISLAIIELS